MSHPGGRKLASRELKKTDMFAVRGVLPVMILLAVLAPASIATSINYEDLETAATSHSRRHEEGGGGDRHSGHEDKQGDRDDRGYKSYHDAEEISRGHHDADKDYGHYAEDGGDRKHHHHDDGYYDEHHEGEGGESGGSFQDKGHYGKGHSTQGHHEVKRLDEYEKNNEFHDEDYDSGFEESDGGHHSDRGYEKAGSYKGGHHDSDDHRGGYGKAGHYEKGYHHNDRKGHSGDDSHEDYYRNDHRHGKEASSADGTKWGYKKGH